MIMVDGFPASAKDWSRRVYQSIQLSKLSHGTDDDPRAKRSGKKPSGATDVMPHEVDSNGQIAADDTVRYCETDGSGPVEKAFSRVVRLQSAWDERRAILDVAF
jgi:hypothetical protein